MPLPGFWSTAIVNINRLKMAPCGCGLGNKYEAVIMAVKTEKSGQKLLLEKGQITLGKF